ncbi:hypothetical protein AB3Y40_09395 [Yoonia sp. R2331]|uniref:hypothetical protein n=1 Tax=Yoonia sp. R2331 TaxID=3237238 RepID=UPI0034E5FFDD
MQSRLEALDPELAKQLDFVSFDEAKNRVMLILSDGLASLPKKVVRYLPKDFGVHSYTDFQDHVDALDDRYLSAEVAGNHEDASAYFMAARFMSAVISWQAASNHFDLCEAAY